MQAYLIDPETLTIGQVEHNGDYREIYEYIGADCFDVARINNANDGVFVDDEGLLKNPVYFFQVAGNESLLAGKGLVLGCDDQGETVAPQVTLGWLVKNTVFYRRIGDVLIGVEASLAMDVLLSDLHKSGAN
jgi:hypothetical protein